jgi:hypothetical protein
MAPVDFLTTLRGRGFTIRIREDGLLGVTPAERLTPADIAALKEHKEALLDLLWHEQEPACVPCWSEPLTEAQLRGMCVPWTEEDIRLLASQKASLR